MPFKSEKQRKFLWMAHPEIAQRWIDEGAKSKGLPEYSQTKAVKAAHRKKWAKKKK